MPKTHLMTPSASVRVWDLPTRLFHWLLVLLFATSWWSAENHEMEWHYRSGITLVILLTFRLIWGVIGGSSARFVAFVRGPGAALGYLRGAAAKDVGHNPVGGYSVVAMLLALVIQVGTGLFATDIDGLESGPLSHFVDFDQGRLAAKVHGISFNILLGLIGLHILAILFYLVIRRRNLVTPMVTGLDKSLGANVRGLVPAGPVRLILAVAAAFLFGWWISTGIS
jgi:cytochrome b